MTLKPPLALSVVARDPNGAETTWWSGAHPNDRPSGLRFSTKRGEGFSEANVTLPRRVDRDWGDLGLLNDVVIVGDEGSIAWEGRLAGRPGSVETGSHSLSPALVGWMSYARQRRFQEVYVDRDLAGWQAPSLNRRAALAGTYDQAKLSVAASDGLVWDLPTESIPNNTLAEVVYLPPAGVTVSAMVYKGARTSFPAAFEAAALLTDDNDVFTSPASVSLTLDDTLRTATPATAERYAMLRVFNASGGAVTPTQGAQQRYSAIAVYGSHGLTTRAIDSSTPNGIYLSDIVTNIAARFCPKLSTAGIEDNTYVVGQAAFTDPTFPYDAWQQLNNFALWELAVWENKTLTFGPADLTDYDWQVRLTDPGVSVSLQGDTIDELCNGVQVSYDDLTTGGHEVITPETNTDLADTDPDNPVNQWGEDKWAEFDLPFPATPGDAAQFGRIKLAEALSPKGAGTINVEGHIRDRAGHWQPAWKVRAGDTIAIVDHPNDRPRLVVETDYTDDTRSLSIAVDSTFQELTAILDRIQTAIAGANLSG